LQLSLQNQNVVQAQQSLRQVSATPRRVIPRTWRQFHHWLNARRRYKALFDASFYLEQNPDVAKAHVNPSVHYTNTGWKEGRDPHPLFDTSFYLDRNPDVAKTGVNPLWHYVRWGWKEGRDPHPRFDIALYLQRNPDVAKADLDPLWHYARWGSKERRVVHP